jgi:hypothetical protein
LKKCRRIRCVSGCVRDRWRWLNNGLRAVAAQRLGQQATALRWLKEALELAREENMIRVFLDEGDDALALLRLGQRHGLEWAAVLLNAAAGPDQPPRHSENGVDQLTEREVYCI